MRKSREIRPCLVPVLVGNFYTRSLQGVVIKLIQSFHGLPQFLNVLLGLHHYEV